MEGKYSDGIKGKVCVTGANGYLASWLVKKLLESGYHVTGTVRDPGDYSKIGHLLELDGAKERLRLMRADLREEGSFDEAVKDCGGLFCVASPVVSVAKSDPKSEYVDVAVEGVLNVLRSCTKSPTIKKVVLTSSVSALARPATYPEDAVLDETTWSSVDLCEKRKLWYAMAKTLIEKAAWDFAKENNINLVSVLPSHSIGPSLPPNIHGTAANALALLKGDTEKFTRHLRMGYVHIDDVARCHILVYENDAAQGRYLCSSVVLGANELAAILAKRYPSLPIPTSFHNVDDRPCFKYNLSKIQKLGMKFKGIEEMFDNVIKSLKEQGHLH